MKIKEYLENNNLIYGNHGHACSKNQKAQSRKRGRWIKALDGTTFDEPMKLHKSAKYHPKLYVMKQKEIIDSNYNLFENTKDMET